MTSQKFHLKYRPDIDGLRAMAVTAVVCFHAFPEFLPGGFIGVDIFFVISGFLISSIIFSEIEYEDFNLWTFYGRRIQRIVPALLCVLIVTFGMGWKILSAGEFAQLGKHILGGASFLSNLFTLNEIGYFDNLAATKPLLHLWSLGIEEQFYIFWPMILLIVFKFRINLWHSIIVLLITSFLYSIFILKNHSVEAFFSPLSRFWELLVGASLAYLYAYKANFVLNLQSRYSNFIGLLGFILVCGGLYFLSSESLFPGFLALFPTIGAALMILAGQNSWLNHKILALPFFVSIGLISYPLYLWHWPILAFARITTLDEIGPVIYIFLIGVSILLAYITYFLVEQPVRKKISRAYSVPILIAGVFMACFLGINTFQREGLPFRKVAIEGVEHSLERPFGIPNCFNELSVEGKIICDLSHGITPVSEDVPKVFLWGDSHAGHLNAGLMFYGNKHGFLLYDYSMSACPPIIDFVPRGNKSGALDENKKCIEHNSRALEIIKKIKPKTVILAANWMQYDGVHQFNLLSISGLSETINLLRVAGIESIKLVGNMPIYYVSQAKLASRLFEADKENRTYKRFNERSHEADVEMRNFAKNNDINFISPQTILCNKKGCMLSVSNNFLNPIALDTSHFTKNGSIYFVGQMIDNGWILSK